VSEIRLRGVRDQDLDVFFTHYQDPVASRMAAFIGSDPDDRRAFDEKWARIRSNPDITVRAILLDEDVVGHVASFVMEGELEVTYWIDRRWWGQGVATAALRQLLDLVPRRPIHGRAAKDNLASLRVLEKCGFEKIGEARGFARARNEEIDEVVYRKDGH
jgi:RimJ/RimL family protein N-acetyltransferase